MRLRHVALVIAVAVVALFLLAPVVSLVPSDKTDELAGYTDSAAYYNYTSLTITYWSHITYHNCPSGVICPVEFSNSSAPEYLPLPSYGSLSYYFLGAGGLYFKDGYTVAACVGNSTNAYCNIPVPCLNNNIPWPHNSCF